MTLAEPSTNPFARVSASLATNRRRLIAGLLGHSKGERGFLKRNSGLLDDYFRESFAQSAIGPNMGLTKNPYAMIALGGYGRQEQCVHSDIDLLFLFDKRVPPQAEDLIREMIYPLWDLGFEVGHATRSMKECIRLAGQDYEVLTSLLDARFISGVSSLYTTMTEQVRRKILQRRPRPIIDWLIESNTARHERFGDSGYLLEPNLKEGQGGLRDYHTMLWIAHIQSDIKSHRDFEYFGLLSHDEYTDLMRALEFVWGTRNRLHLAANRKWDQLRFNHQEEIAEAMGYSAEAGQQPVERFLGELHRHMEIIKQQHLMFLYELGHQTNRRRKPKKQKKTDIPGLAVTSANTLTVQSPKAIVDNPHLLMGLFEESLSLKIPISTEAKRLVREFRYLADDSFRRDKAVLKSFERILVRPAPHFNVLNEMLNTGLLVQYLPEFNLIADRIQYDEYHLYPVDKHSLRVVQTIKTFGGESSVAGDPVCDQLYREFKHRKRLLWAALLHDIGKGEPGGGHSAKGADIAAAILERLGYSAADVETVRFLVREHLLLIKTATRRDINDEETAIVCARRIKDVDRLKMLYLLTIGDSIATGPKAWNDWTAVLLRTLFLKVLNILEKGELASKEAVELIHIKKATVLGKARNAHHRTDIETLFEIMSPRYLLGVRAEAIEEHIDLVQRLGDADAVWDVAQYGETDTRTVTVCAKNQPGLFSKIAGTFALNQIDILDAQVFTWRNDLAVDIFEVVPPPDRIFESERWDRAFGHLTQALAGTLDLGDALAKKPAGTKPAGSTMGRPQQVVVDNTSSGFFTILEVYAYDRPGLLFEITDALFQCELDVWVSKIATRADQVVDVFYVRDLNNEKIDAPDQVEKIRTVIDAVLAEETTACDSQKG